MNHLDAGQDERLIGMVRQAGELSDAEQDILDDMIQSLRKRRAKNEPDD